MVLYHLEKDEKFEHRLVCKIAAPAEMTNETLEVDVGDKKRKLEIKSVRNVDDASGAYDKKERDLLDAIKDADQSATGRIKKFLIPGIALEKSVHGFHETAAIEALDQQGKDSSGSIRKIRHESLVRFWGSPEIALASGKLRELNKSKDLIGIAIAENKARGEKCRALLDQYKISKVGWFKKRLSSMKVPIVGESEYDKFLKREPGRVKELEKAKDAVKSVTEQTTTVLKKHDTTMKEKYTEFGKNAGKFKEYMFSFGAFKNDDELRAHFDRYLAADQRDRTDPDQGKVVALIYGATDLEPQEKSMLVDLYRKLLTKKDVKLRDVLDAREEESEQIDSMNISQLKSLRPGQDLEMTYSRVISAAAKGLGSTTAEFTQGVYVVKNEGGRLTLNVSGSSLGSEQPIKRTVVTKVKDPFTNAETSTEEEVSYKPLKHTIVLDLNSGKIVHKFKAEDSADAKKVFDITETSDLAQKDQEDHPEQKVFEDLKVSGKIINKNSLI
ncbi:MAG: hypothetical protein WCT46_06395 [Candidatus Gracilibacteria bacterium]|jgi:hypothetical protein